MGKPLFDIIELRFGDYLMFNGHTPTKVSEISAMENTVNGLPVSDAEFFDAIPLTAQWLRNLGFEDPDGNGNSLRIPINSHEELCWYKQDGELRLQTKGQGYTRLLATKYVHQLQNLYYSLTGEELNLKI